MRRKRRIAKSPGARRLKHSTDSRLDAGWLSDLRGPYGLCQSDECGGRGLAPDDDGLWPFATVEKWARDNLSLNRSQDVAGVWEAREKTYRPADVATPGDGTGCHGSVFRLGHYIEDYAYLGRCGQGFLGAGILILDELKRALVCDAREFPQGTYAYFTTIDAGGRTGLSLQHGPALSWLSERAGWSNGIHEAVVTNLWRIADAPVKMAMEGSRGQGPRR